MPEAEALSPPLFTPRRPSVLRRTLSELGSLVRYRQLLRMLVWSSLRTTYTGTVLGTLWWVLEPMLQMLLWVVVVGGILGRSGVDNFPLFVFLSVIAWKLFSGTTQSSIVATEGRLPLMKQVRFPRIAIPLSVAVSNTVEFAFGIAIFLVFAAFYGIWPSAEMLMVVPISFVLLTLTLGLGFFLASLNLLYRDVARVSDYVFRAWYFLSPTIWALASIEEGTTQRRLVELNPLTTILEELHKAMLPGAAEGAVNITGLVRVELFSLVVLAGGLLVWMRTEPSFTKLR